MFSHPLATQFPILVFGVAIKIRSSGDINETVTLINTSTQKVDLNGWALTDYDKRKHHLNDVINPGEVLQVPLAIRPGFATPVGVLYKLSILIKQSIVFLIKNSQFLQLNVFDY